MNLRIAYFDSIFTLFLKKTLWYHDKFRDASLKKSYFSRVCSLVDALISIYAVFCTAFYKRLIENMDNLCYTIALFENSRNCELRRKS